MGRSNQDFDELNEDIEANEDASEAGEIKLCYYACKMYVCLNIPY